MPDQIFRQDKLVFRAGIELQVSVSDPGGSLAVLTSAGYTPGSPDVETRGPYFFEKVDEVRAWYDTLDANILNGNFQISEDDIDGMTFSIWKSDDAMFKAAYGMEGLHRKLLDRQKTEKLADRTSYLRTRIVRKHGTWNGDDPVALTTS